MVKAQLRDKLIEVQRRIVALKQENESTQQKARELEKALLSQFMEVGDSLENLVRQLTEEASMREAPDVHGAPIGDAPLNMQRQIARSLERLQRKISRLLDSHGVKAIEFPDGRAVLGLCRVVGTHPAPDLPAGAIHEILRTGYRRGEEVLRPADLITTTL